MKWFRDYFCAPLTLLKTEGRINKGAEVLSALLVT
jgi:hypothetical protein